MRSIYLVVNGPDERETVLHLLRSLPLVEVRCFDDGLNALQGIHEQPPDLLVLGLDLPGIDGAMLTRLLKFDARFGTIPIVCLGADLDGGTEERLLNLGANAFFARPGALDELPLVIQRLGLLGDPAQASGYS